MNAVSAVGGRCQSLPCQSRVESLAWHNFPRETSSPYSCAEVFYSLGRDNYQQWPRKLQGCWRRISETFPFGEDQEGMCDWNEGERFVGQNSHNVRGLAGKAAGLVSNPKQLVCISCKCSNLLACFSWNPSKSLGFTLMCCRPYCCDHPSFFG